MYYFNAMISEYLSKKPKVVMIAKTQFGYTGYIDISPEMCYNKREITHRVRR